MGGALSETLDAMLQQQSVYHPTTVNTINNRAALVNQMVAALENIQELCRLRHRETLVIATSYLVRYINTIHTPPREQQQDWGRVALVCLYMACKIHEPAALPLRSLTDLYQRFLLQKEPQTPQETSSFSSWEQLELNVCSALRWRLHPPMAMAFCDQFLSTTLKEPKKLRKRAQACLEATFRADPCAFVQDHKASSLAMAALLRAQRPTDTCQFDFDEFRATTGTELTLSLAFLQRSSSLSTTPSSSKKQRKRCVSPPSAAAFSEEHQRPRKRSKHTTTTLSPCLISTRSTCIQPPTPPRCLLWTGSPRSALSMAE